MRSCVTGAWSKLRGHVTDSRPLGLTAAGEIGHAIVDEQGALCRCGKRGCLETLAGASALAELLSLATSGDRARGA